MNIRDVVELQRRTEFIGRPFPYIEPAKQAQANKTLYDMGVLSRSQVARGLGLDFERMAQERATEQQLLLDLGLATEQEEPAEPDGGGAEDETKDEDDNA